LLLLLLLLVNMMRIVMVVRKVKSVVDEHSRIRRRGISSISGRSEILNIASKTLARIQS
jgi:hypothetical protein